MSITTVRSNRGTIYVTLLGIAVIVMTLAIGGVLAGRAQLRTAAAGSDVAAARLCAISALELLRLWIFQNLTWRSVANNGNWVSDLPLIGGTVTIDVIDPVDANLQNGLYDPIQVTITAKSGRAMQKFRQTLQPRPVSLPLLQYALHAAGPIRVRADKQLILGSARVSSNGNLRNDGRIDGDVEAQSLTNNGTITGTVTTGTASRALPNPAVIDIYAGMGAQVAAPSIIDKQLFSPNRNPWGATNSNGVYVIRSNGNVTLRNTRVYGTLVIMAPGRNVTLDGPVLFHPAKPNFPALIVQGNLTFGFTSSATGLSEVSTGVNFNPAGTPYKGVTDADILDVYPSEINGLVHVTGQVLVTQPSTVRGTIICEHTGSDAVDVSATTWEIIYDPQLYNNAPYYYTESVPVIPVSDSFVQIVE